MVTAQERARARITEEEIKQDLLTYLRRVEMGEAFIIVKAGKPFAEITPVLSVSMGLRPFGLCAGEFTVLEGFDDPLPEEVVREFEGQ